MSEHLLFEERTGEITRSCWVEPDVRDSVVDYVNYWQKPTLYPVQYYCLKGLKLTRSKYYQWSKRYGKVNEHNGVIPRDFWLLESEWAAI